MSGLCQQRPAYAGIGSRETPIETLSLMQELAGHLARKGWVLRTGMSPGADQAFYRGALAQAGAIELFLPWPDFQAAARSAKEGENVRAHSSPGAAAYEIAARFHPNWQQMSPESRRLLARDSHQVLGADLACPVRLVVCWTPDGDLDGTGARAGGTGQTLRIASHHDVRVLSLARPAHARRAARCVNRSR